MNLEKIRAAAERVARSEGLEVFDIEWKMGKQRFLRVYIDRVPLAKEAANGVEVEDDASASEPAGSIEGSYGNISHSDCERVSQQLSVILDVENLIDGASGYVLEVSSPGLDRPLRNPADFERFAGRMAKLTTSEPVGEGGQKFFEGRLAGISDGKVRVELEGKNARVVEVPMEMIRKANLVVEW
ncbi:MAG TPA: ribosome maturation factor RimP [Candidatus Acidoferrum sp.]